MATLVTFLVVLLMLSGCTNKEFHIGWYDKCLPSTITKYEKIYPDVPVSKLQCLAIPRPGDFEKQSEVASYIVDLTVAGHDCHDNLEFVNASLVRFGDANISKSK